MVFSAILKEPITINGKAYFSARLSMEVNYDAGPQFKIEGVNDLLVCGDDYAPCTYTLTMCNYCRAHPQRPSLQDLHSTILRRGRLSAGSSTRFSSGRWTGSCFSSIRMRGTGSRDAVIIYLLRVFTVYVDQGLITSEDSEEEHGKSLADELVYTYINHACVRRGRFLEWNDAEHRLFEDQMWSAATPLHQEKLANAGQA